jgi:hypothetical protein
MDILQIIVNMKVRVVKMNYFVFLLKYVFGVKDLVIIQQIVMLVVIYLVNFYIIKIDLNKIDLNKIDFKIYYKLKNIILISNIMPLTLNYNDQIRYNKKLQELIENNMFDDSETNTLLLFLCNLKKRDYYYFEKRIRDYSTDEEFSYLIDPLTMSNAPWNHCNIQHINTLLNNNSKFRNIIENIYYQIKPEKEIIITQEVKNITINKNEQPKKLGGNKNTLLLKMENSMKKKTQKSNRKLKTLECLMRCEERQSTLNNINNKQKMKKQLKLLKQKNNK